MEAKDRIIVALDVDDLAKAESLVKSLAPHVGCFKVGLELLTAVGAPQVIKCISSLGGQIFYDGKFSDIPNTVAGAARALRLKVKMFNVHCLSGVRMMKETHDAIEAQWIEDNRRKVLQSGVEPFQNKPPLILGVTLLTSMDFDDLVELGVWSGICQDDEGLSDDQVVAKKRDRIQQLVSNLARSAQKAKLDGVVCSPQEIVMVRKRCGSDFVIVTPGIRATDAPPDDQKRTMTPAEAIFAGADYEVIGRPITQASSPVDAAKRIAEEMEIALERRK